MHRSRQYSAVALGCLTMLLTACSPAPTDMDEADPPVPPVEEIPYETLSRYGLFKQPLAALQPADEVLFYEVAAPLWSDGALKQRFVVLPPESVATFVDDGDWVFPQGTIVVKNFAFMNDEGDEEQGSRNIETRLLIRDGDDWSGHVYLWNDEQTEAHRHVAGTRVDVTWIDGAGDSQELEYVVPNTDQCGSCHERDDKSRLLGLATLQVQREVVREGEVVEQLSWLVAHGLFGDDAVEAQAEALIDPYGEGDLVLRARSWLHANCAHCHQPGGGGGDTGLVLRSDETALTKLGVCKSSVAAGAGTGGFQYDIVPGMPEESIMVYRISSTDPEIKMPELPNRLPDTDGTDLVSAWIEGMSPSGCESADEDGR